MARNAFPHFPFVASDGKTIMNRIVAFLLCVALAAAPFTSASAPPHVSPHVVDIFHIARPTADHSSLEVVQEGVLRLGGMREKLAIVAVVGGYHGGKSFLLNALNGRTNGFEITAGHRATTEGLWICVTDMTSQKDGARILLLDTEGFSSAGVAEAYDAQVFSVATLLSSHLVYNAKNLIQAQEVEYLETLARRAHLWSLNVEDMTVGFPPLKWAVQYFVGNLGEVRVEPPFPNPASLSSHTRLTLSFIGIRPRRRSGCRAS